METLNNESDSSSKESSLEHQILILQESCEKQFLVIEEQNKIIKKFIDQQYRSQNIISKLLTKF